MNVFPVMTMEQTTTMPAAPCPGDFTVAPSGCFYVEAHSLYKKTWDEAETHCNGYGNHVHLAVPNTAEVMNHLVVLFGTA